MYKLSMHFVVLNFCQCQANPAKLCVISESFRKMLQVWLCSRGILVQWLAAKCTQLCPDAQIPPFKVNKTFKLGSS